MSFRDDDIYDSSPNYKNILLQYRLTVRGSMTPDDFKGMEATLPEDVRKEISALLADKQRDAVAVLSKFLPESSITEIRRIMGS